MDGKKDELYSRQVNQLGVVTTIPVILLAGPAVGWFFGGWIDRKFQIYPWFTTILILMGFLAAAREVSRLLRTILKEDKSKS